MDIPTCPVAAYDLATKGKIVVTHYCRWGQDYDCTCTYCSASAYNQACSAAKAWNEETAAHRAWVASITRAFKLLAMIGRTMALVATMPTAIRAFALNASRLYHEVPCKNARYRVAGKRGNAKHHYGTVGVCKWVGEDVIVPSPVYRCDHKYSSYRVGLSVEGEAKLVYLPFKQLERLPESADEIAFKVERAIVKVAISTGVRPRWTGSVPARATKSNPLPMAYIVAGRDRGVSGHVFWIGVDKRTGEPNARVGIRRENGSVVWASVYDCRNAAMDAPLLTTRLTANERYLIERIAADAVMDDKPDVARTVLEQIAA